MNVIISNYPEDLEVPQEYVANVTAAAQKVGELYGVDLKSVITAAWPEMS